MMPRTASPVSVNRSWSVAQRANVVEVGHGSGSDFPQHAALHTDSSFLRLNYGPGSGWGSSLILLPSLWNAGRYYQGAAITTTWRHDGADLVILFEGNIASLHAHGQIRLPPPGPNLISAMVRVHTHGTASLDDRPGEAFKPVALSSMHMSGGRWDAESARIEGQPYRLPARGWIIDQPVTGRTFGLSGGSSNWKTRAPTLAIELSRRLSITGWKTGSSDPNDDNLSIWAAAGHALSSWEYTVTATP